MKKKMTYSDFQIEELINASGRCKKKRNKMKHLTPKKKKRK